MVMTTANSLVGGLPPGLAPPAERVRPLARVDGGRSFQGLPGDRQAWRDHPDGQPAQQRAGADLLTAVDDGLEDGGHSSGQSRPDPNDGKTTHQRLLGYSPPMEAADTAVAPLSAESPLAVRTGQVVVFPKTPQSRPPDFLTAQPATHSAAQATTHAVDPSDFVQPALLAQMISQNDQSPRLNIEPFRQTASLYARQQTTPPALSALDIRI